MVSSFFEMAENLTEFKGTVDEFTAFVKQQNRLVVADFFATWCGPCQRVLKLLPGIAKENPDVTFVEINTDENEELSTAYEVQSIPHIRFLKEEGGEIKRLGLTVGANVPQIKENIQKYK